MRHFGRAIAVLLGLLLTGTPALAQEETGWITGMIAKLNDLLGDTVNLMADVLFADFGTGVPLIVVVLVFGAVYYSFCFNFLNIRAIKHSIDVIRGRYDDPDDPGEISHFQALTSALSATVGLGNIAGVRRGRRHRWAGGRVLDGLDRLLWDVRQARLVHIGCDVSPGAPGWTHIRRPEVLP